MDDQKHDHEFSFDLPDDIWSKLFVYLPPQTISSIRCCSQYFHHLTDPNKKQLNTYWQKETRKFVQNCENLNFIVIPHNYTIGCNNNNHNNKNNKNNTYTYTNKNNITTIQRPSFFVIKMVETSAKSAIP